MPAADDNGKEPPEPHNLSYRLHDPISVFQPANRARAPSSRGRTQSRASSPPIYNINVYGNFSYITNANSHNIAASTFTETTNDRSMVVLKAESITHSTCGRHFSQSEADPPSASGSDEEDEGSKASFDFEASQECRNYTHVDAEVQTDPWVVDLGQLFMTGGGKRPSASVVSQEPTNNPYVEAEVQT
ncbi:hypothetical protein GALMADRAFT_244998 [Galerina marginata CBS 339.88]|uniref:Uncharacterized protein n=1 Tax=Galerina marginata (strain CBS 339.88) TaxID=685588 RepID=A0A067TGD9_GALM3|nr:hypothetical protein GALMADRAFT_244998 [Galerina marginata CBS 339.88]